VRCGREYRAPSIPEGSPPLCECGGVLKAQHRCSSANPCAAQALENRLAGSPAPPGHAGDRHLVPKGGQPAASLPYVAKEHGATVV